MSRCLSDAALIRLLAGDGTADERAHMTACAACGDRHRRVGSELTTVRHVLLATDPPRTRAVARTRSWAIAAVAAPLVVTLAVWGHVAIRGPDAPGLAARQRSDHEASVLLTELSFVIRRMKSPPRAQPNNEARREGDRRDNRAGPQRSILVN